MERKVCLRLLIFLPHISSCIVKVVFWITIGKETRIQKNEERLRNLQDILKYSNIRIIGVPEGEEEEQKIENLFEKILKENFLNLVKEIDMEVQEALRIPKKWVPRRNTPRHITLK